MKSSALVVKELVEEPTVEVSEPKDPYNPDEIEIYVSGDSISIRASTWAMNSKVTRADFAPKFKRNYNVAMRDFASISIGTKEDFCKDKLLLEHKWNTSRLSPMKADGAYLEWFKPGPYNYYMHGDLGATRDRAGFCLGHYDRIKNKVVIDLMISLVPTEGQPLKFSAMQRLVVELHKMGFDIKKVTYDQWQSMETRQRLQDRGMEAELFSVDRDTKAYDTMYDLLLEDGIDVYPFTLLKTEWNALQLINGKVDHPTDGSKDLTDAVAAVCFHCVSQGYKSEEDINVMTVPLHGAGDSAPVSLQAMRQVGNKLVPMAPGPKAEPEDDEAGEGIPMEALSLR